MRHSIIKCTNCGTITPQEHILPLCGHCFDGLEDYEEFLAKAYNDVEIIIDKKPVKPDTFLMV